MLNLATKAPGLFPADVSTQFFGPLIGWTVGGLIVLLIGVLVLVRFGKEKAATLFAATCGVLLIAGSGTFSIIGSSNYSQTADNYYASVSSWLDTDYGITATAEQAQDMVGTDRNPGTPLEVTVNGTDKTIALVTNSHERLSVMDLSVLAPNN